ncbi:zinc finger protein 511 isoform X2 [Ooceraea biroi]|uniref:zinc finger protein 511 isoform X2 n=1 Tax=Ooceraea biroi TaxID=2015173 RepID=UPI0005BAEBD0|nr:zinc finger protein 511 isoform X2 [Ooceraea biroi]
MEEILEQLGVGIRPRKGVTIDDEEELCHEVIREFSCYVPGCRTTFQTLLDYEMHYNSSHRYTCTECKVSRPNPRLLEIHVQEMHDAFFKVLSEKQPMYQCYDSECDIKFNNSVERREHCIRVHKFPKKYRFEDTPCCNKKHESDEMEVDDSNSKKKIDKKNESDRMEVDDSSSKKKVNKVIFNKNQKGKMFSKAATSPICTDNASADVISTTTTKTKATSLTFIPRQVQKSFSKVLTNNQTKERNVLETETMMELADSLPD